jgi:hypothetical protein
MTISGKLHSVDGKSSPITVTVTFTGDGIHIRPEGYGDFCSADGHGVPVLIETYNGSPRVVVWSDITREDPTHVIPLTSASEDLRDDVTGDEELRDKYLKTKGVRCPYCDSSDIEGGSKDTQDDAVFQSITCGSCNREWTDEYTLTGVTFE